MKPEERDSMKFNRKRQQKPTKKTKSLSSTTALAVSAYKDESRTLQGIFNREEEFVDPMNVISSLRRMRGIHKRKITIYLRKLTELHGDNRLTSSFCKSQITVIEKEIEQVKHFDEEINNVLETHEIMNSNEQYYNEELDSQAEYSIQGYLRGYALKVVKHLTISDRNYHLAIEMLKEEFLDVNYIIDETFKNILNAAPSAEYDQEFSSVNVYLNEIKSYLHELKAHNIDLLEVGSSDHEFVSHIVFNKLPIPVMRELVHKLDTNYPNISDILSNYNEIIKTLSKTVSNRKKTFTKTSSKPSPSSSFKPKENKVGVSTIQNFKFANKVTKLTCKLCAAEGHTLGKCVNFNHYNDKVARLRELSLCTRCAGSGHEDNECYGKQNKLRFECLLCREREHTTPLCPSLNKAELTTKTNVSLCFAQRSFDASHILPTMTLYLRNGKRARKVRCLFDTGSQRSYISESAAKDLCQDVEALYALECDISTYIGRETKGFKQMSTGININNNLLFIPLLVDKSLNINFEVPGMNQIINKFKENNIALLDETFCDYRNHERMKVDILMGIDII
ncbi:uncharacterized protein [Palaemon carinicauda]|uniref:uncharacterized protein n=1 Tax=Palaemon carinicauda TaxID=392227 RepID=UPI0035B654B1